MLDEVVNARHLNYMIESEAYEQIGKELDTGNPLRSAWAKALVMASGNPEKQKLHYINLRLSQIVTVEPRQSIPDNKSPANRQTRKERQAIGLKIVWAGAFLNGLAFLGIMIQVHFLSILFLIGLPLLVWGLIWHHDNY